MKGEKTPNINHIEHLSRHEGERLAFDRLHTNHATAQPLNDAAADDATITQIHFGSFDLLGRCAEYGRHKEK